MDSARNAATAFKRVLIDVPNATPYRQNVIDEFESSETIVGPYPCAVAFFGFLLYIIVFWASLGPKPIAPWVRTVFHVEHFSSPPPVVLVSDFRVRFQIDPPIEL
jgi:hypothetical protein